MYCLMCGKEKSTGGWQDILFGDDPLCKNCRRKWKRIDLNFDINGIKAQSPYLYNDAFAKCLIQYKECGDEALKDVFLFEIRRELTFRYQGWTLCLLPSSKQREKERGFSHLEKMFSCLKLQTLSPFAKREDQSQKHKSALERKQMETAIILKEGILLPKKIVLCDDTITTGATIRGALKWIDTKKHNIRIFSVSVNQSWFRQTRK